MICAIYLAELCFVFAFLRLFSIRSKKEKAGVFVGFKLP